MSTTALLSGRQRGFSGGGGIIPYLIAMLAAIALLRRPRGALDLLMGGLKQLVAAGGWDARWVDALPTRVMKSLSAVARAP